MKICIFTETYYPVVGGAETQVRLLADGLIAGGHSVIILTRRSDASLKKQENYGDVMVHRLHPIGRGQFKKWGLLFSSIPMLIRLQDHYDLIFVSGYRIIGLAAVLAGKLLRKPVVLKADSQGELSGAFFESGLKKFGLSYTSLPFRLFLRGRNALLRQADAFSAISLEIAAEWASQGVPACKVCLIPNSVDTIRFVPVDAEKKNLLRKKLNLPQAVAIAIYTGRLVTYKGLPLLLRVWKEICRSHENILLLLVGSGGLDMHNCEAELHEYVELSGLEKHVLFTGDVRNVWEYLQASDIFVFPTENEAFGASLVEAMSCGLPVITTPVGAIKTIVSDNENGILVRPREFEELYRAFGVILFNELLAARLGKSAWQTAQQRFANGVVTQKYLSLFQSLLSVSTQPR